MNEKKKRKREKGKNNRSHVWKKKAPKPFRCCSVSSQSCMNESMKLLRSERPKIIVWKSLPIIGFKMWYRFDVSWKIVVFTVQSGLKLYDFTIVAARVETNRKPSGSWFRGRARNMVNNSESKNWESEHSCNLFCLTFYFNCTFGAAWRQSCSTAGKTMLVCVVNIAGKKFRPFWLSVLI